MISVKAIDAILPQTQCGECGYAGCLPYAKALAQGTASIDLCPPGGVKVLKNLGALLNIDPTHYEKKVLEQTRAPSIAVIREAECIGCTKCIQACPVDAIVGTGKKMHTVLADECTGCGLCVEPCPVDCIDMLATQSSSFDPEVSRLRFQARITRQAQYEEKDKKMNGNSMVPEIIQSKQDKQNYILQALARANKK